MLSSKVFLEGQPNPSVSSVVKSERASVARTVDWNFLCGQLTGSVCKQLSRLLSSIVVDRVVLWTQRPWQSPSSDFCHPRNPCIVTLWYGVEFPLWSASTNWFSVCEQVQQALSLWTDPLRGHRDLGRRLSFQIHMMELWMGDWNFLCRPANWFSVLIAVDKVTLRTTRPWRESLLSSVESLETWICMQ